MKKLIRIYPMLLASIILGFGGGASYPRLATARDIQPGWGFFTTSEIIPLPIVQEMIDQVEQARALTDLRRLTGVEPICTSKGCKTITSRFTGSAELQVAKDYVYETLVSLHYNVEVLNWSSNGLSDQDILAHTQGIRYPNEEIYFIAHLDGYPQNGPAADDDGTGVVALLEMARIMARMHPSRSVTFFFSTGEEQGVLGSHYFVNNYHDRLAKIKYLVSVEMLGYDSNNDFKMQLWSADQNTVFQQMLGDIISAYTINLVPDIITGCT